VASTGLLAHFIRQIELYLTAVGLLVILAVPQLFAESSRMFVMALTAIGVGVVHGVLFCLVRRRQRLLRAEVLNHLSTESLTSWQSRYREVIARRPSA